MNQLFGPVSRIDDLVQLSSTLNVTDFFLWQMTTIVNFNVVSTYIFE